ncbi:putative EIICB-Mtl [Gemella bergeri ATCC 700627]|uniref:PTS system mannitol-specific EIICB component n=1 Tax=Gemella bergeri ATCC 700627 TaxID=1321820 RepID=U2S0Y4_9BACL|nr:PTS mannitol transporter subunit IICB [Gemella bergeri]ERK56462.1 putative EIICB-Mtl [Gemella bergeri ATCC 700627]
MNENKNGLKVLVQKIGTALSSMVMPNIGAFIAWGLITAFFIETGWTPNAELAKLVNPMVFFLLPLLIAYSAGKNVYEERGGVIAAIATMGVIVGTVTINEKGLSGTPMFLGAMVMGPIAAVLMKKFDKVVQPKIKTGLEMLVNNFSLGILGFILSIIGYFGIGPIVKAVTSVLSSGVDIIINAHLLPLANLFIEPAKVLFLNNAINHGILTPIATEQALNTGKSVLYLLETNPGVGLGILLAYMFFGKGTAKASAPGAAIIHFIGGIHEIYFPYILMKPSLIIAAMAGGISGTATFQFLGAGLRAPASPGSILAVLGQTASGSYFAVISGAVVSTLVTFIIAAIILKRDKREGDLAAAQSQVSSMKAESKGMKMENSSQEVNEVSYSDVKKIIFACDAGMGSSAMGASILRNKVKKAGLDYEVTNVAIRNLTQEDGLLIVTQNELTPRAKEMNAKALHISVDNFLSSPKYDEILENLKK